MPDEIDDSFLALPLARLADAALSRARERGARYAALRVQRVRSGRTVVHDGALRASEEETETGLAVRVLHRGAWGFAATPELTPEAAVRACDDALELARACADVGGAPVALAPEPAYPAATWRSPYRINPFEVPESERAELLSHWCAGLLAHGSVAHVLARVSAAQENTYYADLGGTGVTQQRVRVHPQVLAVGRHPRDGGVQTLRTVGPPVARGWEYLHGEGWDWAGELAELPALLAEKTQAPPVRPGRYDLVIDPSQLWLTIHESVGHATEYDRALGHEMSYAGGTFATPDAAGRLRYGSSLMTVDADRSAAHGLATVGFDDEGVAAQSWPLIEAGVLAGFQHDRASAAQAGLPRSSGCAYAESYRHTPMARMPNVSLRPAVGGPDTAALIAGVTDGFYLAGSDSWSIDMRRRQFQFTAQRWHRIRNGRLAGQVSGAAYQAETTAFWSALCGLGGEGTWLLSGADMCGKGQPVQASAASHGCPAAVFRGIDVVDTGGRDG
ncbi:TldD/PmbA family protein [Micromonospora echinospora]|uniref:TldD/PmbA family protein n=1 Tax=Micromonospora echinospora TaxID=1877 RepID=UPI003447CCB4